MRKTPDAEMTVQRSMTKDVILFTKASRPTVLLTSWGASAWPRILGGGFLTDVVPKQDGAYISGVVKRTALRGRFTVISRIVATAIVLILAFAAFWLGPLDVANKLNPVDILTMMLMSIVWLAFAGIVWFKWDLLRDAGWSNAIRGITSTLRPPSRRSAAPDQ